MKNNKLSVKLGVKYDKSLGKSTQLTDIICLNEIKIACLF